MTLCMFTADFESFLDVFVLPPIETNVQCGFTYE